MTLVDYIIEAFTPGRRIKSGKHLWDRKGSSIQNRKEISDILDKIESPTQKNEAIQTLYGIVQKNYKTYGEQYFKQGPNLARYGALALSTIGGISAGTALLTLAAGGPLTAIAAVAYGLANIAYGGVLGTIADVADSKKATRAIEGKYESSKKYKGILGYVRKILGTGWGLVTAPFRPSTYKSIYHNFRQIAEGLAWRNIAYWGSGYTPIFLGPWGQIGTFATSAIDFYRGRKKFDNKVIDHIVNESVKEFQQLYGQPIKIPEDPTRVKIPEDPTKVRIPVQDDYSSSLYEIMQGKPSKLSYIKPRKAVKA